MSPRINASVSPSLKTRTRRHARKRSRVPGVLATAAAAATIGAIGASAGSAPWTNAISGLAMDANSSHVSATGHSPAVFDSVLGAQVPNLTNSTAQPQHSGGTQLDSRMAPVAPGIAGALIAAAENTNWNAAGLAAHPAVPHTAASKAAAPQAQAAPAMPAQPAPAKAPAHAAAMAVHAAPAHTAPAAPAHPAPAHPAPAHPAPAHAAPAHAAARVVPAHHAQAHASPVTKPFLIYDSVSPSSIPSGHQVATYVNGAYAASASAVAGRGNVLWIDTNGSDTHANALDVEPGDATPAGAAAWVQAKLDASHNSIAIVYTMISDWQAVKDSVAGLPHWMQSQVRYWIADPTGVPHVLPGANATQWYWGNSYDITTANPGFES